MGLLLSDKYIDFMEHVIMGRSQADYLEGTTYSGKTTVGAYAFMLKVMDSDSPKASLIAGLDIGTVEKNIINAELGILDMFSHAEYFGNGTGKIRVPHIQLRTPKEDKIIYIVGYDDKKRWQKILGGQMYASLIDEINVANMDFVREAAMRSDYIMATLNPDNPDLEVYKEYINRSRPLKEYAKDAPKEINELLTEPHQKDWVHWFFHFGHNPSLTEEKKRQIIGNAPVGTKLYKNKIQGLRGRATGLVFNIEPKNLITKKEAKAFNYNIFTVGVDTAYSRTSDDTFAFVFGGITACRKWVGLKVRTYNNRDLTTPITPSDVPKLLHTFLEEGRAEWGFGKNVFIDSADQGTILECQKYKKTNGLPYVFQGAFKKTGIIDRINLQGGWMAKEEYLIVEEECEEYIKELNTYSWQEKKDLPEDANDHLINAAQYSWLPYKDKIGVQVQ